MKIVGVVGTRPNFIKMAPVILILRKRPGIETIFVHTGQHFDDEMSDVFFRDLNLPAPDVNLGVGGFSPWVQTAQIIAMLGDIIEKESPDWVFVPGDVNSTLAGAIAAVKAGCKLAHLESGLRSFDRSMPEELNRIATDHLSDLLFVTEPSGLHNLKKEGISESRIRFVGNTMIDTLLKTREIARNRPVRKEFGLGEDEPFILVTIHRPATVDNMEGLKMLFEILKHATIKAKVIFPVHPRTSSRMKEFQLYDLFRTLPRLLLTEPLGYINFLALLDQASVVMTDSGGIQEETTVLGTACLTLRQNTERPITCTIGTNRVVGTDPEIVKVALDEVFENPPRGSIPDNWDGKAAQRVLECILNYPATASLSQVIN